MKIYLLIIKYWTYLFDSLFPKKNKSIECEQVLMVYQKDIILPTSYHTRHLLPYKNPYIKRCIWNFKYYKREAEIKTFSTILQDEIIALLSDELVMKPTSVIYPPSSSYELGQKDFNHMEVLLKNIDSEFFTVIHNAVLIKKDIRPQHTGTQKERRLWSSGKYILHAPVTSHHVICVDDVLTTGSTLNSMNMLLKDKRVYNLTLSG